MFEWAVICLPCDLLLYPSLHRYTHSFQIHCRSDCHRSAYSCFVLAFIYMSIVQDVRHELQTFLLYLLVAICTCGLVIIPFAYGLVVVILVIFVEGGGLPATILGLAWFPGLVGYVACIFCILNSDCWKKTYRRVCCLCTSCCSEDVPSQETAPVECPPPVQRDEQTAVTIECEEEGPTAMLGTPSPAQATPPPDKPETQGDLTTAVPPSYKVHIQPRWLGNHCKGISNPVYRLLMANCCLQM